jgi:glycosyltransferase involved in cell wall biosynthesis
MDIQPAVAQRAGVGRYVKCLAERLGAHAGEDQLRLYYFDFRRRGLDFSCDGAELHAVRWVPGAFVQQSWKRLSWPPVDWIAGPSDLYHFTNFIRPPLRRGRSIVTIYDVSFLRFPEAAEPANLAYLEARIQETVNRSDAILTISTCSKEEISKDLGVGRDRIFIVPPGLSPTLRPPDAQAIEAARKACGLDAPYLLFVATLEPRKNISFLVDVFDALESFDGDLVLAGKPGWKVEPILDHIEASNRRTRIRRLDFVDDAHLPGLYGGASCFVFPSLHEGFGFPPLEAMACGAPVVASNRGALPETLGDAAVILDSFERDAWVERIGHLLADETERARRRELGFTQAGRFNWDKAARATWDIYRTVAA